MRTATLIATVLAVGVALCGCNSAGSESQAKTSQSPPNWPSNPTKTVSIPMRDGVKLTGSLKLPNPDGKFSTILVRTPYGRDQFFPTGYSPTYATISVDVRGRGTSEGVWEPFLNERQDGFDTVQWIAQQPWSNGKVAMVGASYMGYVQWAAAVENPPALKCIVSDSSPPDPYQNIPYENGVFLLATNVWYTGMIGKTIGDSVPPQRRNPYKTLPVQSVDKAVTGRTNDVFQKWLTMEKPEDWSRGSTIPDEKKSKVPALLLTGWKDGDHVGSALRWAARPDFPDQYMICGAWGHGTPTVEALGDLKDNAGKPLAVETVVSRFIDHFLGDQAQPLALPKVMAFMPADRKWHGFDAWPPKSTKTLTYYPGSDGSLSTTTPSSVSVATYDYDPTNIKVLPQLRRDPLADMDVVPLAEGDLPNGRLLFRGAPLKEPIQIAGTPIAHLSFSTSAVNTDFFVQLLDLTPEGTYIPIGQAGKFRARYTVTQGGALLAPGKTYEADVKLWDTAYAMDAGHRLTLMISSDRFPVYALNLNTGEPLATGTRTVVAHQSIVIGGKRGTRVEIPTVTLP